VSSRLWDDRPVPAHLTLLHGFAQNGTSWAPLLRRLRTPVKVLAPDLRGHGRNRRTPCDMDGCLVDLEEMWAGEGIVATHLVGYSMGGRLALHIAAHRPDRLLSLCTIGAHAGLPNAERDRRRVQDEELASRIEERGIDWFTGHWGSLTMFESLRRRRPELAAELDAVRGRQSPAGLACSLRGMGAGAMEPVWERLHSVRAPALVVAGADDLRFRRWLHSLERSLPDGRSALVPEAGHAAHLEQPEACAALLDDHLSSV
jgi:2-succinyl-6-hydroxy-2,4-cyclohexadiene-1-carboxylate synthase